MNKKGAYSDLFLVMIFALIIVVISVVFVYMGGKIYDEVLDKIPDLDNSNETEVIDNTIGEVNYAYSSLTWLSVLLIGGMVLSVFIGSYMVTTKPVFFIPYIFIWIIAIILSVGISNGYETMTTQSSELASTFTTFTGANWWFAYLPVWIAVVGIIGGVIMYSQMGKRQEAVYYG